ncbi:hypothetical protein HAX54_042946, partial [Datura stramonium]|nr:hypothetical protein [Datura stramonium]
RRQFTLAGTSSTATAASKVGNLLVVVSIDASRKLDFSKWCSLVSNFKHSTETYSQGLVGRMD